MLVGIAMPRVAWILCAWAGFTVGVAAAGDRTPTKYDIDERSGGKLVTTTDKIRVLSAPNATSTVLGEYDEGSMMVVLGAVVGTEYLYISPCNACEKGFVSKGELRAKSKP